MVKTELVDSVQDYLGHMPPDPAGEKFNSRHNMLTMSHIYGILLVVCTELILKNRMQKYFMQIL